MLILFSNQIMLITYRHNEEILMHNANNAKIRVFKNIIHYPHKIR